MLICPSYFIPDLKKITISDKYLIKIDLIENDSFFASKEGHSRDKQSLKISKRFDNEN